MSNETTNRQHSTSVPLQEMTWTKYGQTHCVRWVNKMRGDSAKPRLSDALCSASHFILKAFLIFGFYCFISHIHFPQPHTSLCFPLSLVSCSFGFHLALWDLCRQTLAVSKSYHLHLWR
ncbi:unnamed protein product [Prunus brigantina]